MNETPLPLMVWAMMQVGLPLVAAASANASCNGGKVVAIHLDDVPAEGAPLIGERLEIHDVLHEAVELDAVVIDNAHTLSSLWNAPTMAASQIWPFLTLAIAEHAVGARRTAVEPRRQTHAERERKSLAQRTGGGFERGNEAHVGMALINRAQLAQRVELVLAAYR